MLTLLAACATSPPGEGRRDTEEPVPPVGDTDPVDTDVPAGPTGDTSAPAPADWPVSPPPAVDCAALAIAGPGAVPSAGDPRPFDTRADGLSWFADDGVYEGTDPAGAALVYDLGGDIVREDPYGSLYWIAGADIWRVPPGGVPGVHATGLSGFPRVPMDLEVHPFGALLVSQIEVGPGSSWVTYVDPAGTLTTTETTALAVRDVAWASDWRSLWVATEDALYSVPVDPYGAPDWTAPALVATLSIGVRVVDDVTVDACGGVYLLTMPLFFPGRLLRYDPATGLVADLGGGVDHGYGRSPMRFGRASGAETVLGTLSGGWSYARHEWLLWDVGVGAPAWP